MNVNGQKESCRKDTHSADAIAVVICLCRPLNIVIWYGDDSVQCQWEQRVKETDTNIRTIILIFLFLLNVLWQGFFLAPFVAMLYDMVLQ